MIAEQILDVQFFNGNHAEAVDQPSGGLMAEVVPPIADALMDTRNDFLGFLSLAAPAFLFGKFALCLRKSLFFFAEEARVLDKLAIGQSREGFQANINTDGFLRRRQVFGFDFLAKAGEPLVVDTPHRAGLEFTPRLAMEFSLHLSNFGKADGAIANLETVVLGEGDAVVLAFAFETGEAWGVALLYSVKERFERKVYTMNHVLQDLAIDGFEFSVVFLPLRQVGLLGVPSYRNLCCVVLELPVVDKTVVNKAAGFERLF